MTVSMEGLFAQFFWGEAGFEQLRKSVRQNASYFGDIIAVLDERAELEIIYSKGLQKLTSRLSKVCKGSNGVIDSSWKIVADSLDGEGVVHKNLGLALKEEIIQPLKRVFETQQKAKKSVEHSVDKSLKRLNEKRADQLKLKRQSHSSARDCEKVQRSCDDENRRSIRIRTEKQIAKLESKRMKFEENVLKTEDAYRDMVVSAEKERSDVELALCSAASQLENIEHQRLSNLQTALGRYQRHMLQFGPALTEMLTRHIHQVDRALSTDIQTDLRTQVAHCQPQPLAYRSLLLWDSYEEDFSQLMSPERRRTALSRQLLQFQKEIEKERKGKEGLEYLSNVYETTPAYATAESRNSVKIKLKDSCTLLCFLDYHLYKLQCALCSLEKKPSGYKPTHSLSKYEEKHKDKAGLRQTVLRVPLYATEEVFGTQGTEMSRTVPDGGAREQGDGQSPPRHSPVSEYGTMEPIYESLCLDHCHQPPSDESISDSATNDEGISHPDEAEETITPPHSNSEMEESFCRALYDFVPQREDELTFKAGDEIRILTRLSDDWWEGSVTGDETTGLFPTNYIEIIETL